MKTTTLLIAFIPSIASACPIGMNESSYGFGNSACVSGVEIRQITTKGRTCPNGFSLAHDKWNNVVCSDGHINTYNLASGCPNNLTKSWDSFGRNICNDDDGHAVVELVD